MDAHQTLVQEILREATQIRIEWRGVAEMLRNVAAVNWDTTRKEFVAAAVEAGYNPHTASIQFNRSRQIDLSYGYCTLLADGRLAEAQ